MSATAALLLAATCGTMSVLPAGPAPLESIAPPHDAARGGEKDLRDAFGGTAEVATSANFALKWGSGVQVGEAAALTLLSALEESWDVQVQQWSLDAPPGTDQFLFNVYIGDSGDGTPPTYDVNYFSYDSDDYPMIVLHPGNLDDPDYAATTIAHEFFHAVQAASGNFIYWDLDSPMAWYWEASATWAMGEVFPDHAGQASMLFGYAFQPHLSVEYFRYADASGAIDQLHQYGAFIFLRYLSEQVAGPMLIRDSWGQPTLGDTPIRMLDRLLEEDGSGVDEVFAGFAATNATWDYALGELYASWLDAMAPYYEPWDDRIVASVSSSGTDGWVDAPAGTWPNELAYNLLRLPSPTPGDWELAFEGDLEGTHGSDATFDVVLVRERLGAVSYETLSLNGGSALAEIEVASGEDLHLAVSVPTIGGPEGERFGWSYRFEPSVPEAGDDDDDLADDDDDLAGDDDDDAIGPGLIGAGSACACDSSRRGGALSLLALLPLALAARRRRPTRRRSTPDTQAP